MCTVQFLCTKLNTRRGGGSPPEMGYFFMLQVYDGVGSLLNEVYERVGKSVISVCKKAQKD